jgi:pyrimidine-nucleoside phosphorylase
MGEGKRRGELYSPGFMRAVDLIRTKRDGGQLDRAALEWFVAGVTDGTLPDYQASALLMAIVLRGMTAGETAFLTDAMVRSGVKVDYPGLPRMAVDKHSTGGVGDKTSIILAPLAAACGAYVPMMSGRGLGHTGGTLDKLESIPGFRTGLSLDELRRAVETVGCALIGQTSEVAPADRKLYALRDVTGTVESIPLITASIMSKKIAEGIGGLVLDVKCGDGAFMKTEEDARALARSLVDTGELAGVRTEALLTRMDAPLGLAVGNALEIIESIETLKGRGPADLESLSVEFAARMLVQSGLEPDVPRAEARVRKALSSGAGVEKFREIIATQGGDPRVIDDYSRLPAAPDRDLLTASRDGVVVAMRAEAVGRAAVGLGAGRDRLDAAIDPAVGFEIVAPVGTRVKAGDPIVEIHHRNGYGLAEARRLLEAAIEIGDTATAARPLVIARIQGKTT